MDFPLLEITDDARAEHWLEKYFHPTGLCCPRCDASVEQARRFRQTRRSHLTTYRCRQCDQLYSVYTGTLFAHKHLRPPQVILLLRGICKGESTASLARELELAYDTVHHLRQQIQKKAQQQQPETPLPDSDRNRRDVSKCGGKKAKNTLILRIPHVVGLIN